MDEIKKGLPELAYPPSAMQSSDSGTADEAEGSATAVAQEVKIVTPENALESGIPPGAMQVDEPEAPTASISPGVEMAMDELVNCPSSQAGEPRKAPACDIVQEIVPTGDSSVSISQSAIASRPAQSIAAMQHSSSIPKVEPQGLSLTELLNQVYRDALGIGSSSNIPLLIDFDGEETVPVQSDVHSTVEPRNHSNDENFVNPPCDTSFNAELKGSVIMVFPLTDSFSAGMTDSARIVDSSVNADEPPDSLWQADGVPSRSKLPSSLGSTLGSRQPHNNFPPLEPVPARSADVTRPRPTASSVEQDIMRDKDLVMQGQQPTSHSLAVEISAPIAFLTAFEVLGGQPDEDVLNVPEHASGVDTPESDVSRAPSPEMHLPTFVSFGR
ncbi:uncharacterized protein LAESUDRAFT_765266 [Laetiporus sulphureus 93-53]|uniref:Uncharacterized protein n=1 Tax=Laetiporus sulphureus 93-53 TaxID=1314785 RepID=A0A165AUT0_9APHY|nr:uncharacterized protein LAESUDRAFT_765266 [Laetiporus sulphureus 93-53]KZS99703.1 hypothetical protein LAESUDRAFT_765266 [Laetiporus sulphureus 93-53]